MILSKIKTPVIIFVGLIFLISFISNAEDIKVGVEGDATEYETIQAALSAAGDTDRITILPSFEEYSNSNTGGLRRSKYVTVKDNYAYMNMHGWIGGFVVYDISDPTNPTYTDSVTPYYLGYSHNSPYTNAVQDGYLYHGEAGGGLGIVDVSDPQNIFGVGFKDFGGQSFDVAVEGDYAYLADTSSGLGIYNVADKSNPVFETSFNFPAGGVSVKGDYVYLTDYWNEQLRIFDVSNPSGATEVGNLNVGSFPVPLEVKGNYAYVQEFNGNTVHIVDISNPNQPTKESEITLPSTIPNGGAVTIQGELLYATTGQGSTSKSIVSIYDISDIQNPREITSYETGYTETNAGDVKGTDVFIPVYDKWNPKENKFLALYENTKKITKQSISNPLFISPGVNASRTAAHWNELTGSLVNNGTGVLSATLNYWGADSGPTHPSNPDGSGALVSNDVIYSPWLGDSISDGTGIDADPDSLGVQLSQNVNIIVDDVGPKPTTPQGNTGYLNQAIWGSNYLPYQDTIKVRDGTYDATQQITDPVEILNTGGSTADTTVSGPIFVASNGVILGGPNHGFTVTGDITVTSDANGPSTVVSINRNVLKGDLTHNGTGTVDALFNYWGPDGPEVSGNTENILLSPWLLDLPGTANMTYKVGTLGADPQGGVARAIEDANTDPQKDEIRVDTGTYTVSSTTPIAQPVELVSCTGCPTTATLQGELLIDTEDVKIGGRKDYTTRGFNIEGDVTVANGVDASTVQVNWNNIYGTVTNKGTNTLDATYNFWGSGDPASSVNGAVDYTPYLPDKVCKVLDYMSNNDIENPKDAVAALVCEGGSASERAVCELTGMGLDIDQAEDLLAQYGLGRVRTATEGATTSAKFAELLGGYSLPAGAGGSLTNNVVAGGAGSVGDRTVAAVFGSCETIEVNFPLADFQGRPTKNLTPTVSLVRLNEEGEKQGLTKVTTAYYSENKDSYVTDFSSCELTPGYYLVQIDLPDLSSLTQVIEVEGKQA